MEKDLNLIQIFFCDLEKIFMKRYPSNWAGPAYVINLLLS